MLKSSVTIFGAVVPAPGIHPGAAAAGPAFISSFIFKTQNFQDRRKNGPQTCRGDVLTSHPFVHGSTALGHSTQRALEGTRGQGGPLPRCQPQRPFSGASRGLPAAAPPLLCPRAVQLRPAQQSGPLRMS